MAPTGSQPILFCQPQPMNASSAVPLAAAYSSFPTVPGFPLPPASHQQQYGLNSPSSVPHVQMSFASTVPTVYISSMSAAPHQQQNLNSMSFPLVHNPLASSSVPTMSLSRNLRLTVETLTPRQFAILRVLKFSPTRK